MRAVAPKHYFNKTRSAAFSASGKFSLSIAAGRKRGYDLAPLRARQVTSDDFARFDWLLAMDAANLSRVRQLAPAGEMERAQLFLEFAGETSRIDVPDPYYGKAANFEIVLDLLEVASRRLLHRWTESM